MKVLRLVFAVLVLGAMSISTAYARDSFSIGINIGGGHSHYAPLAVYYYPTPHVVYYSAPVTYYRAAPHVYYYPSTSFVYRHYDKHSYHHRGWNSRSGHYGKHGHNRHRRHY